ncbi:S9 family peptidase [Streptomyces meridianus]|uniref:Prolyl oligopeptidase family serine peptidase n=1 Tax=Streptomyces meridianus TaxID=2938945 RepID=A0ABT0X4I1_9ACTN|nr:prolyl oligopeptidase family serine peptidase [Streptomyces meridianus]MCM2577449.1 prolyl oligopeptidase family serine peptidase [Streptomyces meridianus]
MPDASEFPRQFARTRRFSLGVPRDFTVSPDGERVVFLRTGGGRDPVSRLWSYEGGRERLLAGPELCGATGEGGTPEEELLRRERAREQADGVVAYATDRAAGIAAFALNGELWAALLSGPGSAPFRIPAAGPVVDPRPSPDGRHIAYVSAGALHVTGVSGHDARSLAEPDGPEASYGLSDHVAAESMHRRRGFWWAPDGRALLVARVDNTPVRRWYIGDPARPGQRPRAVRYPVAGTANADVSLHIVTLDGRRTPVRWDRSAFEYLATAGWDEHGPLIGVQSRDQRTLRFLSVDPATGDTTLRDELRDRAWVELVPGTPARTASGALVRHEDDGATRRLSVDGRCVTPEGLQLREVLAVDGEKVLFTASEDPVETHVWSYRPETGCALLSSGPGLHTAVAGGGTLVLDGLTPAGRRTTVRRAGRPDRAIASLAEEPLLMPRPAHSSLGERRLRGALYLPSWYEPGSGPLPVLLDPYGGPAMQVAVRARTWASCVSQWFADEGFAVLVTDGRGTQGRGPVWEKAVRGDTLTAALDDQVDALRAAAKEHPELDLGRVAIRGWSFGGYLAAGAVLRRPDVFHAAVAGAPPADQRLYDTHWKERFLGHPDQEPRSYDASSLIGDADRLRRPLLLVHGLADDNVFAAHTLRLSAALLAAGRPHSVLPLPGVSHMAAQEDVAENLLRFQLDFLKKALGM